MSRLRNTSEVGGWLRSSPKPKSLTALGWPRPINNNAFIWPSITATDGLNCHSKFMSRLMSCISFYYCPTTRISTGWIPPNILKPPKSVSDNLLPAVSEYQFSYLKRTPRHDRFLTHSCQATTHLLLVGQLTRFGLVGVGTNLVACSWRGAAGRGKFDSIRTQPTSFCLSPFS